MDPHSLGIASVPTRRCTVRVHSSATLVRSLTGKFLRLKTGLRRQWKPEPKIEARSIVQHFDASPVKTRDGADKTEAKPVAGGQTIALQAIKALENVLVLAGGNSRPIISDGNDRAAVALRHLHRHLTGFTAMLDRVINQIGHRIEQEVLVAGHQYTLLGDNIEAPPLVF